MVQLFIKERISVVEFQTEFYEIQNKTKTVNTIILLRKKSKSIIMSVPICFRGKLNRLYRRVKIEFQPMKNTTMLIFLPSLGQIP